MSREDDFLTSDPGDLLKHTVFVRRPLEEQYHDLQQQAKTAVLGMWLFLATEVMFFGALFLSFAVYRYLYAEAFAAGSASLNWRIGTANAIVLLVSDLMAVLAVHYAQLGNRRRLVTFLLLTVLLGTVFMMLKGVEYHIDFRDRLVPGVNFDPADWIEKGLAPGQVPRVQLFLVMYWVMTLLHAVHLTIGIVVMLILAWLAYRKHYSEAYYTPVDVAGLYWHFVDIIWIFLLPLLYLLGTNTL
jgi:cytochrome c oxidase subunit 3